jgi:hypothetical protein
LSLLGHAAFFALVIAGVPCLNTLHPGPSPTWLCHLTRFVFYLALAIIIVRLWRVLSGRPIPGVWWGLLVASIVWAYWFILDPSLFLLTVAGTRLGKWCMEHTYGRPLLGELYWGWGFARYQWWLAAGQGVLSAATLLMVSMLCRRRTASTS